MADLVSDIAHIITGVCGGTCCHVTGGRATEERLHYGQRVGGDEGRCECRDTAREIIKLMEAGGA